MSLKFLVHAWGLRDSVEQIFRNKALWLLLLIKCQGVIVMKILTLQYFFLFNLFNLFIYWLPWVFVVWAFSSCREQELLLLGWAGFL